MFNLNSRQAPTITGNATTTIRGNRLINNGTPLSEAQVINKLQRDIYHEGEATGDTFTGGVSIRLATFNTDGEYIGLVKKLSATFLNNKGSTAVKFSDTVAKAAISGKDISSQDFGFRFQIGLFDTEGKVISKYDDREHHVEYGNGTEDSADPLASFSTGKPVTAPVERKGIGFINIFSWSVEEEKYFRIGATQLDKSDGLELVKLLTAAEAGYGFAPVVTPTKELAEWLSVKDQAVEANPLAGLLDPA